MNEIQMKKKLEGEMFQCKVSAGVWIVVFRCVCANYQIMGIMDELFGFRYILASERYRLAS